MEALYVSYYVRCAVQSSENHIAVLLKSSSMALGSFMRQMHIHVRKSVIEKTFVLIVNLDASLCRSIPACSSSITDQGPG